MIKLYYHAGSGNHGCEAIVRSTRKILQQDLVLYTSSISEDLQYHLNDIVNLKEDKEQPIQSKSLEHYLCAIAHKINHNDYRYIVTSHKAFFNEVHKGDIYLSIGGDNYCYKGQDVLGYYNKEIHKRGAKTVLWGCSVDEHDLTDDIKKDLALYDLIITRETISYNTLKSINPNTYLLPDPAFQLDTIQLPLPDQFIEDNIIGINLSPLIGNYGNGQLIYDNYVELIKYIINSTNYNIALIPHVIKDNNDDLSLLSKLYEEYKDTNRICLIEDHNCMELKGYIARCKMFIGARTHATIAAYSSCIPTLVVGYSVKSIGIARDIFGSELNYVKSVQDLSSCTDLLDSFKWLDTHQDQIRNHLKEFIPEYKEKILQAKELIDNL